MICVFLFLVFPFEDGDGGGGSRIVNRDLQIVVLCSSSAERGSGRCIWLLRHLPAESSQRP